MSGFVSIFTEHHRAWRILATLMVLGLLSSSGTLAQGDPEGRELEVWSELDAISDLLIDGHYGEGRARAESLLEQDDLPPAVASRAVALFEKAEEKLAEASAEGPAEASPEESTDEPDEVWTRLYRVRVALVGEGFSHGDMGLLKVGDRRMLFIPWNEGGKQWSVSWSELAEASEATGIWDAPYPIVLVEVDGSKRYIARIDNQGAYMPPDSVLAAIVEARANSRRKP